MSDYKDCGILYFAIGARFAHEAERSAATVRRFMPDIPIAIICDHGVDARLFDIIEPPPPDIPMKRLKMEALRRSPFERTLYLDTDTALLAPVWEVFDLLKAFDLAMVMEIGHLVSLESFGPKFAGDLLPQSYPTWNGGVIACRKGAPLTSFLNEWDQLYQTLGQTADQISLRETAFRAVARIAPLPPSYNYHLNYPGVVRGAVKILHGREPDISIMTRRVNQRLKARATVTPRYARNLVVYGDVRLVGILRKRLRKLWWKHFSPRRQRKLPT